MNSAQFFLFIELNYKFPPLRVKSLGCLIKLSTGSWQEQEKA